MSKWAIGGLAYLIVLAVVVKVAGELMVPALPFLFLLLLLVLVFRRLWRGY